MLIRPARTVPIRSSSIARRDSVVQCSSSAFPSSSPFGSKRKCPAASSKTTFEKQIANVRAPGGALFGNTNNSTDHRGQPMPHPRALHHHHPDLSVATLPQLRVMDRRGAAYLYEAGLEFARRQDWQAARRVFKTTTELYPDLCRAWVSWAQMEKKAGTTTEHMSGLIVPDFSACRAVLQRGLELNPGSSCLCQAWGLMELQQGNTFPAVKLLDRSAEYDPNCKPIQRWKLYKEARKTVSSRVK